MQEFENVVAWMIAGGPRLDEPVRGPSTRRGHVVGDALRVMVIKAKAAGAHRRAAEPACCPA
jgi:hypothetical protein